MLIRPERRRGKHVRNKETGGENFKMRVRDEKVKKKSGKKIEVKKSC